MTNITCSYMFPPTRDFVMTLNVGVTGLLVIFGLLGNGLSIAVMKSYHFRKGTTTLLLVVLAISDSVYLVHCLFFVCISTLYRHTIPVHLALLRVYPYVEPYIWATASMAQTTTTWMVVVVTAERYIAICWPLRSKQLCTISRARFAVGMTVIVAIIYNIPRFWELHTVPAYNSCLNISDLVVQRMVSKDSLYWLIYSTILHFLLRNLAPFLCLLFFNFRLVMEIIKSKKRLHEIAPGQQKAGEGQTFNVIVTVVVLTFLMCSIPEFIYRVILTVSFYKKRLVIPYSHMLYYGTICNLLLTLNSAINCLIYYATGRRFREILCEFICKPFKNTQLRKSASYVQTAVTDVKLEDCSPAERRKLSVDTSIGQKISVH